MDELMKRNSLKNPTQRELTCSVYFTNPKHKPGASSSSEEEIGSVTRLISNPEDLELENIFKKQPEPEDLLVKCSNRSLLEFGHNFENVPNWLDVKQPGKDPLSAVLRYMIETHMKTTVQIEINKMYFNCHLSVLQVYSKFFMDLNDLPLVVSLPEDRVSQRAFMLIYKWMLSDEPHLEREDIVAIYVAATYLRIESLLQHCWQYFDDCNCFNEDTACVLYVETLGMPALDVVRNLMLTRVQRFLLTFVATRNFLDLPVKHLHFLLDSNSICVNTEIEILFIIVRWLGHDWNKRSVHLTKLIKCIRFQWMPLWYLLCVRREESHELVLHLLKLSEVDRLINEAIANITATMYDEGSSADQIQKGFGGQRQWIKDKSCDYHHLIGCPNTRDIRYKHFESYLLALQQQSTDYWSKLQLLDLNDTQKCCQTGKVSLRDIYQRED
ncbi:kelch-like protein 40b [Drosophila tropicalis]|uniref:kelch-like protein 40b n=1 Tax=Drosophila tropicalis TaxID=46794 RepID=UPI0035ABC6F5